MHHDVGPITDTVQRLIVYILFRSGKYRNDRTVIENQILNKPRKARITYYTVEKRKSTLSASVQQNKTSIFAQQTKPVVTYIYIVYVWRVNETLINRIRNK